MKFYLKLDDIFIFKIHLELYKNVTYKSLMFVPTVMLR